MKLLNDARITEENSGLTAEVTEAICSLAEKHKAELVILFGSRARGDFKKKSDIDLAVSADDFSGFCLDTDEETPTLLKYDFVDLKGNISEELLSVIEKEGRILYSKR